MSDDSHKRGGYFTNPTLAQAFLQSFIEAFGLVQRQQISRLISVENVQRFRHGKTWNSPANENAIGGEMQTHSMVMETAFQDLVDNKLALIPLSLKSMASSADAQFSHMVYSGVSAACDLTGNTVDAKALGSMTEAFAQMLEKVEFGVGRDGQVSMPEIHLGSEAYEKFIKALNEAPPEFAERIDHIKARKSEEAQARELERLARFSRYGD